ncbi:chloride channel protein [Burkholderia sp. WAC0059]|uniref:chloride channel protein n=1 Tax=Burkholderia sp. WAC0059 TaxID=2066022 RepID=UPI000C7EDD5E|nr:chloride channel protein [Burkholderia sp. WAC0059]PLZ03093.1 chloride channel protein [Burkholderia sp. WAC0059]
MSTLRHAHRRDFSVNDRLPVIGALAAGIGVLSTVAAWVLMNLIHLFTNLFFFARFSFADRSPAHNGLGAWVVLVPVAGGLIVGLIARYGSERIRGHGIPEAIEAILFGRSRMSAKVALLKPLASGIAIGSGGPFGAEGPIIMTGGALGSLVAQRVRMSAAERKTLLVAGAAAGMTAVFGTPVAAVLLAVELLLFEWRPRSLIPVALACAVAGFVRSAFFGTGPLFPLQTAPASPLLMLSCVVAGLVSGALAAGLSAALYRIEDGFARLRLHWMWWPMLGGLAVGAGGLIEPHTLGVGYDVIGGLLHRQFALQVVVAIVSVKAVIWLIALGSGTSGGVLAPLLMLGAGLGVLLGHALPADEAALCPLLCMAATLGATLGAPLTAIVFAFGLTHDGNALLPLLAATLVAHAFSTAAMRRSIMTEKIARRGRHIYREYGVDPLERHHVEEVMSCEVETIDATLTAREALARFFGTDQRHRAYPVVEMGRVLGIADRDLLRTLSETQSEIKIGASIQTHQPVVALESETCRLVATRLAVHDIERMPVVTDRQTMRLVGIVSRSDLVGLSLAHFDEEHRRERFGRLLPIGRRLRARHVPR